MLYMGCHFCIFFVIIIKYKLYIYGVPSQKRPVRGEAAPTSHLDTKLYMHG
jgi:hypothetical protein